MSGFYCNGISTDDIIYNSYNSNYPSIYIPYVIPVVGFNRMIGNQSDSALTRPNNMNYLYGGNDISSMFSAKFYVLTPTSDGLPGTITVPTNATRILAFICGGGGGGASGGG